MNIRKQFLIYLISLALLSVSPTHAQETGQAPRTPIPQIQGQYSQEDDSALVGQAVTVEGVVTGVYGDLFFVQEPTGGPWSGIAIYRPGHQVEVGDAVTVQGVVAEFHDLTEIQADAIQVRSRNNPLPDPQPLPVQAAKNEKWEGVLVQVQDLTVAAKPDQHGEWRVRDASGLIIVDDKGVFYPARPGEEIAHMIAIVDHAFGTYRLIPRSLEDIRGQAQEPASLPALTPVYAVQGAGVATPLAGQRVNTVGVVTGVGDSGFFLQDPVGDGDPRTSDGVYVYTSRPPGVTVGQCVLVRNGAASEYYDKTELSQPEAVEPVDACGNATIAPVPIPLGQLNTDPVAVFEPYEGMLVTTPGFQGVVQGPTKRFSSGDVEIGVVSADVVPYLPAGRVYQAEPGDGSALIFLSNVLGVELPEAAWGDRVWVEPATPDGPIQAILDYNFGKYQLMLLPGQQVQVEPRHAVQDAAAPAPNDGFTVCTFNVWGLGRGGEQYRDQAEYDLQLRKRALAIAEGLRGCTIIGVQETGEPEDAANLAQVLTEEFGLPYTAVAIEGPGSKSLEFPLTNSLLARSDRVEILNAELVQGCSRFSYSVRYMPGACPRGQFALFNRPPLVVDLAVEGPWGEPFPLTVIVNHWKSKGGDESVNVVRRTLQAEHVASLVQARLDADPNAHVVVLGDLNDYYASGPVEALRTGVTPHLIHTYDLLPWADRYTYIFNGASQVLDHILIAPGLLPAFAGVDPLHINADFPVSAAPDPADMHHSSDHDPVVMTLRPGGVGWIAGELALPGVLVEAEDDNGVTVARGVSDVSGAFRLWGLPPGAYRLVFTAPEGATVAPNPLSVEVTAGAGTDVQALVTHPITTAGATATLLGGLGAVPAGP